MSIIVVSALFLMLLQVYGNWLLVITLGASVILLILTMVWNHPAGTINTDHTKLVANSALNAWLTTTIVLFGMVTIHDVANEAGIQLEYNTGGLLVLTLYISVASFIVSIAYHYWKNNINNICVL